MVLNGLGRKFYYYYGRIYSENDYKSWNGDFIFEGQFEKDNLSGFGR